MAEKMKNPVLSQGFFIFTNETLAHKTLVITLYITLAYLGTHIWQLEKFP